MSKFNKRIKKTPVINLAGGEAYAQDPRTALISLLLTSFAQAQFYRSEAQTVEGLSELISRIPDKKFVAKSAIYARTTYGMRSITHVLAGEIGPHIAGQPWAKDFYNRVVQRPDDMTEILAYIWGKGGKESNAIRKGFAAAFGRFDEYQLAKYRKAGTTVSLVDVVNVIHPPHSEAVAKLVKGTLASPDTWEVRLTQAGQEAEDESSKAELKREVWERLVRERKIGYFALLRNLKNIVEQAPELVPEAVAMLTDERLIRSSLVLPFRYVAAMTKLEAMNGPAVQEVLGGIARALDLALANVPRFDGSTLVVLDGSGSMAGRPIRIGSLFAAVLVKSNAADYMTFSHDAQYQTLNVTDSTLTVARLMEKGVYGGGTNFHAIFERANRAYDRIIILSDMQGWIGQTAPAVPFADYRKRTGADPHVYSVDLQGYGTLQFPERNVYCLAGFSPRIFDVMKLLEEDREALIHEVEKVDL